MDASTGQSIHGNPVAKVTSQVDGICPRKFTCTVFFVHVLLNKVVANHWQEVCVAYSTVLCLRDKNLFFFVTPFPISILHYGIFFLIVSFLIAVRIV